MDIPSQFSEFYDNRFVERIGLTPDIKVLAGEDAYEVVKKLIQSCSFIQSCSTRHRVVQVHNPLFMTIIYFFSTCSLLTIILGVFEAYK